MQPVFKSAATLAVALSVAGLGTLSAQAGGKSPPAAYDVTLENVTYDIYGVKLTYPKIDIKGSNIPKADLEKMLAAGTASPDRLKAMQAFTAGSAEIPTTNLSFEAGTLKVSASCTGEKLEKIAAGKVGKYSFSGCSGQVLDKDKTLATFTVGLKSGGVNDYNFVHAYRLWVDKAGPEDKDAVALTGPGTAEGLTFAITAPGFEAKGEYAKMTATEGTKIKLLSRPLKDVVAQVTTLISESANKSDPDAPKGPTVQQVDQIKQIGMIAVELFENLQPGAATIENYTLSETITDPKLGSPFSFSAKAAKIETKGFDQQGTDITFNGGKITGKLGSYSWKGFSFGPIVGEAKKLLSLPSEQLVSEISKTNRMSGLSGISRAVLSIYANIGTVSLNDLEVNAKGITKAVAMAHDEDEEEGDDEAPATPAPAQPATPETVDFTVKLKNFTWKMEKPFNAIPTTFRFSFDNLQIPAIVFTLDGKASSLKTYKTLQSVGLDTVNMSHVIDLGWNKDAKELNLEIGGADAGLGSVSLKGTLGNFTETMFSWDQKAIQMAAIGLTAKNVSLHTEDKGGLDKLLKITAAEQGQSPEQLKAMVPMMAAMIPEPLASMSSVQTIKKALLDYWANPGKLDIAIKAKNGVGLGLADLFAASQDPTSLDSKIDVTATATK